MKIRELFETSTPTFTEAVLHPVLLIRVDFANNIGDLLRNNKWSNNDVEKNLQKHLSSSLNTGCQVLCYNTNVAIRLNLVDGNVVRLMKQAIDLIVEFFGNTIKNMMTQEVRVNLGDEYNFPHVIKFPSIALIVKDLNQEISLKDIHKKIECQELEFFNLRPIKSNVLGILNIKGLTSLKLLQLETSEWFDIVNKHLKDKDILQCQEDLIDAGLKDYAKL